MASVSVLVLLFSLVTSSFSYTVKSENVFNDELEIFYNTILRRQTEVNILNKKISDASSEKIVDSARGLLPQINSENGVSSEDLAKLYANIQAAKASYGKDPDMTKLYADIQDAKASYGKDPDMKKLYANIQDAKSSYGKDPSKNNVVTSVNLTVYHRYEDVDNTGKKMHLFFGNQGPSDAVLLKRQEPNDSKQTEALCGSVVCRCFR